MCVALYKASILQKDWFWALHPSSPSSSSSSSSSSTNFMATQVSNKTSGPQSAPCQRTGRQRYFWARWNAVDQQKIHRIEAIQLSSLQSGSPSQKQLWGLRFWESAVNCPTGVWGKAPGANDFGAWSQCIMQLLLFIGLMFCGHKVFIDGARIATDGTQAQEDQVLSTGSG